MLVYTVASATPQYWDPRGAPHTPPARPLRQGSAAVSHEADSAAVMVCIALTSLLAVLLVFYGSFFYVDAALLLLFAFVIMLVSVPFWLLDSGNAVHNTHKPASCPAPPGSGRNDFDTNSPCNAPCTPRCQLSSPRWRADNDDDTCIQPLQPRYIPLSYVTTVQRSDI